MPRIPLHRTKLRRHMLSSRGIDPFLKFDFGRYYGRHIRVAFSCVKVGCALHSSSYPVVRSQNQSTSGFSPLHLCYVSRPLSFVASIFPVTYTLTSFVSLSSPLVGFYFFLHAVFQRLKVDQFHGRWQRSPCRHMR